MRLNGKGQPEIGAAEYMQVCQERDDLQARLNKEVEAARGLRKKNEDLLAAIADHTNHAHELAEERDALRKDLGALRARNAELLDLQRADYERAILERDKARAVADAVLKEAESQKVLVADYKKRVEDQVEVIERLKAQNGHFVEEQREAKKRADATAASLVKAKDDVARLVGLLDGFKEQLVNLKKEKAAVTDQLRLSQADYDARGRVIKKLRKRLHKLKKKLKH